MPVCPSCGGTWPCATCQSAPAPVDTFDELVGRVKSLTGLTGRQAATVAMEFDNDDEVPTPAQIVAKAQELGFEVETPIVPGEIPAPEIAPEITMDPATVLAEVYENCPRVMMANFPSIGRAPSELEANEEVQARLAELPDEVRALLVKVDLLDSKMTVWLRDEANDIDRPVGPIDLRRYDTGEQLHTAIGVLLRRLPLILRADSN